MWWTGVVAQPTLDRYEWWVDGDFAGRTTVTQGTTWDATLDMSSLTMGIHTLDVRAAQHWSDDNGTHERWSATLTHFFLVPRKIVAGENKLDRYEWWIDHDLNNVNSGKLNDNGVINLTLDMSSLPAGVHTIDYRVVDAAKQPSQTLTHYFLVPRKIVAGENKLDRYEWWLDKDRSNVNSGKLNDNGVVNLTLDMSSLPVGVHTIDYRVVDAAKQPSQTLTHYFLVPRKIVAGENKLDHYEWWLDKDRSNVNSGKIGENGIMDLTLDLASLTEGIHTIDYRVVDVAGQSSQVISHFFIVPSKKHFANDITIDRYEWWIDKDRSTVKSGKMGENGVINLTLDLSTLNPGVHTLDYCVLDNTGAASATLVKYFVVLNPNDYLGDRLLTKYAYWFNRGDRIEVEVTPPAARIDLKKQVIPVENVVPNQIGEDYVFDVDNQLLQVTDDVVVGLQVFDNRGVGSAADTVVIHDVIVPVDPHFLAIKPTDDPYEMSSPTLGVAQGFYYDGYERDSLQWVVSGPKMPLDFFDAQGNRIKPTLIGKTAEATTWGLRTPTDRVYAIARDAEVNNFVEAVSTIDLILIDAEPGDVNKDGYVTAVDLSIVVNILAGLDNAANYNGRADVNKDGNITAADISMIVNIIAGISN
ncbi:MAG: hypothetical protein II609_04215 [Muribaculaceae bacterium]|nr:hypothetical protein [Muribaculaceae bacterium]